MYSLWGSTWDLVKYSVNISFYGYIKTLGGRPCEIGQMQELTALACSGCCSNKKQKRQCHCLIPWEPKPNPAALCLILRNDLLPPACFFFSFGKETEAFHQIPPGSFCRIPFVLPATCRGSFWLSIAFLVS